MDDKGVHCHLHPLLIRKQRRISLRGKLSEFAKTAPLKISKSPSSLAFFDHTVVLLSVHPIFFVFQPFFFLYQVTSLTSYFIIQLFSTPYKHSPAPSPYENINFYVVIALR